MLPQTLPIRFLLNLGGNTVSSDGPKGMDGPASPPDDDGGVRPDFMNPGSSGLASPGDSAGMRSGIKSMRRLEGLGKALGLTALWFKEAGYGYERVPFEPMAAYSALAREILEDLKEEPFPTHFFAQAGNGEMAAALTVHFREALGDRKPRIIIVEPANADCVLESVLASKPTPDTGDLETSMRSLASREVSRFAWTVLREGADAFLSISDHAAEATVILLRNGEEDDPSVKTGPSGAAGLAGLIAASFEPALTGPLALGPESRVLAIGWEGPA